MSPLKFAHISHTSSPVFVFHSTAFPLKDLTLVFKTVYKVPVFSLGSFLLVYMHTTYKYTLCFHLHYTLCVWMSYSPMFFGGVSIHSLRLISNFIYVLRPLLIPLLFQHDTTISFSCSSNALTLLFSLIVTVRFFLRYHFMSIHLSLHSTISFPQSRIEIILRNLNNLFQ